MRGERKRGIDFVEEMILAQLDDRQIIFHFRHQTFQGCCSMFEAFCVLQNAPDFVASMITPIEIGLETKSERPQRRAAVWDHLQERGDVLVHAFTTCICLVYVLQDGMSRGLETEPKARTNGVDTPSPAHELEGLSLVEYLSCLGVNMLVGSKDGVFVAVTVRFSN